MTVSSITNKVSVTGNNTAGQTIPFTYPVGDEDELVVVKVLTSDGTETVLTKTTDYTVSLNDEDDGGVGGTVTLVSAISSSYQIHVVRSTDEEQLLDLVRGGTFNGENIEDALDRIAKRDIDQDQLLARCLHGTKSDTTTGFEIPARASRLEQYLYFDASGNITVANPYDPGTLAVSDFSKTVLDDANAPTWLTTLGFTSKAKTLLALSTDAAYLTALGVTAFAQNLLLDETAAEARETLDVIGVEDIVCYDNAVVCYENEVVTYS